MNKATPTIVFRNSEFVVISFVSILGIAERTVKRKLFIIFPKERTTGGSLTFTCSPYNNSQLSLQGSIVLKLDQQWLTSQQEWIYILSGVRVV
jgi:hypothetical protein